MSGNDAWITTDKTRYCQGEQIVAALNLGGTFIGTNIRALLTGPDGKTEALEPNRDGRDGCRLYTEAGALGEYTLVCVIEYNYEAKQKSNRSSAAENTNRQNICSTCFFVGDCEAAIPTVPDVPFLFVPEMWEEPNYYKLKSLYLTNDGKPVPLTPVTLIFRNKSGRLKKELCTDASGNVFFAPYMAGIYCLISKGAFYNTKEADLVEVTTTFSFALSEREGKRLRTRKQAYYRL